MHLYDDKMFSCPFKISMINKQQICLNISYIFVLFEQITGTKTHVQKNKSNKCVSCTKITKRLLNKNNLCRLTAYIVQQVGIGISPRHATVATTPSQLTMIYEIGKTRFKRRNTDKLLTIKTYNIFQRYLIAIIIYLAPIIW